MKMTLQTTTTTTTIKKVMPILLLLSMSIFVTGQFNEPPGQRREQTYRILEYEASNINQHYSGLLRYYCTFRGKWSAERHPNDFPSSPSWSAPIIVSHSKNYRMWTGTETVTAGVEYVAEVSEVVERGVFVFRYHFIHVFRFVSPLSISTTSFRFLTNTIIGRLSNSDV